MSYVTPPLTQARIKKTRLEAEYIALQTAIMRGEVLHFGKLLEALGEMVEAIRAVIAASRLSGEERAEIRQNLDQIFVTLAQARKEQRRSLAKTEGKGRDGDSDGDEGD